MLSPQCCGISIIELKKLFPEESHCMLETIVRDKYISYNDFFIAVSIFLFYDNSLIFSLLLSFSSINSNIIITDIQVKQFAKNYNFDDEFYNRLVRYVEYYQCESKYPSELIPVKLFHSFCFKDEIFIYRINHFKAHLQGLIYSKNNFRYFIGILRKVHHYYCYFNTFDQNCSGISIESEEPIVRRNSLCQTIQDVIMSRNGSYKYDYFVKCPNFDEFVKIILMVKQHYGYSMRF